MEKLTPKERIIKAFRLETPDCVPTMELDFQLTEELFGARYYCWPESATCGKSKEAMLEHNARLLARVADHFDYSAVMIAHRQSPVLKPDDAEHLENWIKLAGLVKKYLKKERLLITHGDATYAIPSGTELEKFSYDLVDRPEEVKENAQKAVAEKITVCKRLLDGGFDGFALCSDYAFNRNPFLSPHQFREFITPYLAQLIEAQKKMGAYVIKHSDGNIMPIIDQLIECGPDALHSLDPQGGVDIKEVKKRYGKKVCLIGNVNCGLLQTGTKEEILASAAYALENGKPGGGYVFSTSNCVYKGMPLENYLLIHNYYLAHRNYSEKEVAPIEE